MSPPLAVLTLAQFPLYGAAIGACAPWRRLRKIAILAILGLHGVAAAACFSGLIPNFS